MDVNGIQGINSLTSGYSKKADTKDTNIKEKNNESSLVDLGKDEFVKSEEMGTENITYKMVKKKLSSEEIQALKDEQENLKYNMIRKFIEDTINNQKKMYGNTDEGVNEISKQSSELLTKIFGSVENAYPPIATTPDGAKAAISEGGAYSVNAVADRIMKMAQYIAGDDKDKLLEMKKAVEKGFEQAGVDFKNATDSSLPQICLDTCDEVIRRFDELLKEE